jgi:perosamine synthetase
MTPAPSQLALLGGPKSVQSAPGDIFTWPIITPEIENAVLDVLRAGRMSNVEITQQFEKEFAAWLGMKYALAHNTGTSALHGAFFGTAV